jgi:type II secretory pathway pseudopilin PulG
MKGNPAPQPLATFILRRSSRGAFTLIESMMASVILAGAVVVVCGALHAVHQQDRLLQERMIATSLARQLMEEISGKPFLDPTDGSRMPGPELDESTRADFDNIDDYHGYSDNSASITMLGGQGLSIPGGFTRSVQVEYRTGPSGPAAQVGDFAHVTVTVTGPGGQMVRLVQLMTNVPFEK